MIYILHNIFPIFAAMLVGLVIGLAWLRMSGRAMPSVGAVAIIAVCEFWLAAILAGALILAPPQAGAWQMALGSAVIIWVGFILPAFAATLRRRAVEPHRCRRSPLAGSNARPGRDHAGGRTDCPSCWVKLQHAAHT